MKKLLLILFYIGCFFFLLPRLYAQSNQTVNNGSITTAVNFPGTCTYNWVNSDPSIGLAASGTGDIPSFTAVNTGKSPVTATITATPAANGFAYIANNGYGVNSVSVIDIGNNKVVKTIPVGANPYGVTVNHAGTFAYVSNTSGNFGISVIDTKTNLVSTTISLNSAPTEVIFSPDDSKLYVANDPYITVINTRNNTIIGSFTEGGNFTETGLAISPDGQRLYISDGSDNDVLVVNTTNYSKIADILIGYNPHGIALSPDGTRLYVPTGIESIYDPPIGINDNLTIVNTATNAILTTIPVGQGPYNVVLNNNGSRAYVANSISNSVTVINTANYSIVTTVPVGNEPFGLSSTADGSEIFVANNLSNNVNVINTTSNSVIATIGTGISPISYGSFIASGSGCGAPVVFSITVNPTIPPATITTTAASGVISACVGSPSADPAIQQFTVSGSDLTAPVIATAPAGFEISLNTGSGYGKSVTLNQSAGNLSNIVIYIRSAAGEAAGPISGTVVLNSTGAAAQNVAVSGVVNALPTVNKVNDQTVTNGTATTPINFTGTGDTFTWTNDSPGIGLAAGGTGNIASFTAINTGNTTVKATVAVTPYSAGYAYVANTESNDVSVINTGTNTVVKTIPVGNNPLTVAVSPDDSKVYVANQLSGNLSVISTATNTVTATIPLSVVPSGMVFSPDGSKLYVSNDGTNIIYIINTSTNSINGSITSDYSGYEMAITPDGKTLYVADQSTYYISVINTVTNSLVTDIQVGQDPYDVIMSPDGTTLYSIDDLSGNVCVINTATNKSVRNFEVGPNPYGAAISPDGKRLYVANQTNGTISVINTADESLITLINTGGGPSGVSLNGDGSLLYVADHDNGTIVINTATNKVLTKVTVGKTPISMGNFITKGSGCPGVPVSFTITVNPALPPTVSADGNLLPLTTIYGSPSPDERFTVWGTAVTSGILITPPAGFEVSLDNKAFSSSVTIGGNGNISQTPVFFRLAATTHVGSYSGNVTISTKNAADAILMVPVSMVTPATLNITADNKSRPVNTANPQLTITYSGFVNGEGPAQLTAQPEITTAATISSAVGEYTINVANGVSPDYIFNYNAGTLTITPYAALASIPNAFTPNGDGINDTWIIKGLAYYPKSTVNIFNRWGQKIFTSVGYPIPWDGTYQGKILPSGAYYYIIDPKDGKATLAGWVAIIR